MPAYVTLPGTSGNYFDTPDVNLLDADTAHVHQSVGTVDDSPDSSGDEIQQSQALTPVIGDYHGQVSATGTAKTILRTAGGASFTSLAVPISANTDYAAGVWVASPTADRQALIRLQSYNSTPSLVDESASSWVNLTNEWQWIETTVDSGVGGAYARVYLEFQTSGGANPSDGDLLYWDAMCIREGTDGSFERSLRIVNDLEIEWKVALDDYTPAATNTILDCLNSNDGYRIRHTTGDLIEVAYGNGSSTRAQTSSATGLTDGDVHVFKVTIDQSTGAVVYYIDGVQHDTDTMTTGVGSRNINDLVVGANAAASANWTDGGIYYVTVRDGISGPIVAKFDADDWVGV